MNKVERTNKICIYFIISVYIIFFISFFAFNSKQVNALSDWAQDQIDKLKEKYDLDKPEVEFPLRLSLLRKIVKLILPPRLLLRLRMVIILITF